ncbi:MAG: hypothetical protein KJO88_03560, partial [Gammaproteobacteria bacterium]|nr:hypothetical protein [Gammaproteobacteria bacterium]
MISKKSTFLILGLGFVLALVAFTLILKPGQSAPATSETLQAVQESVETSDQELELETVREFDEPLEIQEKEIPEPLATGLSADLQAIKDGKQSVLGLIFSDKDLNQQLDELLQLSEAGESWADYAIGQVTEMCAYLYETPESQLIAMFSGARAASSPEQQAQMTELLPMVVDASKRCKTLE